MREDVLAMVRLLKNMTSNVGEGKDLLRAVWVEIDHHPDEKGYDGLLGVNRRRDVG